MNKKLSSVLVAPVAASGTGEPRPGLDLVGEIAAALAPLIPKPDGAWKTASHEGGDPTWQ